MKKNYYKLFLFNSINLYILILHVDGKNQLEKDKTSAFFFLFHNKLFIGSKLGFF